ncbi:hypothetical protein VTI28DRAFT_5416 [Corynascus sepedonium]
MGGKTWSREEEEYYWLQLVPHSPKRLGEDIRKNEEKDWHWIGQMMTQYMGDKARREYTYLCVLTFNLITAHHGVEHYYLNAQNSKFSPNVGNLCARYWRHEQYLQKQKAKEIRMRQEAANASKSDANLSGESSVDIADSPIEVVSTGGLNASIVINCQYPTTPYQGHAPSSQPTVPSARTGFAFPNFLPPPSPSHPHQFSADHNRLVTTELGDNGMFATQQPASWMNAAAPHWRYALGGTTPTLAELAALLSSLGTSSKQHCPRPTIRIMIRPRGPPQTTIPTTTTAADHASTDPTIIGQQQQGDGQQRLQDFLYTPAEFAAMVASVCEFATSGLLSARHGDGFVFGVLHHANGQDRNQDQNKDPAVVKESNQRRLELDVERNRELIQLVHGSGEHKEGEVTDGAELGLADSPRKDEDTNAQADFISKKRGIHTKNNSGAHAGATQRLLALVSMEDCAVIECVNPETDADPTGLSAPLQQKC